MKLGEVSTKYPVLADVVQRIKDVDSVDELYPPQAKAIETGFLDGKNLVLSIPTASGKTLVAELALMSEALKGKKAIYLTPLRALASEKFEEMKEKYRKLAKIAISTGEYDSSGKELADYDIMILTNEKMDSLMRHKPEWLEKIGVVVIDEVHLLNDKGRGPTLEIVTTKLKKLGVQFIALSATIENSDEIAKWLDAELVESEFRPVQLARGVFLDNSVAFKEKDDLKLDAPPGACPLAVLTTDIIQKKAQSLIFVNTRRSAEKEAEENGKEISALFDAEAKKKLEEIADQIENVLDSPTKQCKRLGKCVRTGTAFHHAGLHAKQRSLVENNFKQNVLKLICATPTLAAGVNLPSKRVVIRDYKRYGNFGMEPIPILEIHQMFGRAGRPKYDTEGEAILVSKSVEEFDQLWDHYIDGRPEPISSKLGVEPILRMHTLGLIAEQERDKKQLFDFFGKTFYALQYEDMASLEIMIDNILDQLFKWGFMDHENNRLKCTKLGLRVAQLYLDPMTAFDFLQMLERNPSDEMVILTILSDSAEMRPLGSVRRSEEALIFEEFEKYDLGDEQLRAFKNAFIFFEWMQEKTDDFIFDTFGMPPGSFRTKLSVADWLLYACGEISRLSERDKMLDKLRMLRKRLKYGVKRELLPLIRVRNIGRARARNLFGVGIKSIEDIKNSSADVLSKVLGKKTALKIMEQLDMNTQTTL
jgi:helicase